MATLPRAGNGILNLLHEYYFLTPDRLAKIRGTSLRAEQRNLNLLARQKEVKRLPYLPLNCERGVQYVYHTQDGHSRRTLDHELDITDFHIKMAQLSTQHGWELIWQQKHMTGTFYPDAYFSIRGLHFFLEIERQKYGNVKQGKPSIIRKADAYYEYYESKDCMKRWGFDQFRVIFQLKEINPDDFLGRIEHKHRLYWVGTPDSLTYRTNKGDQLTFSDL